MAAPDAPQPPRDGRANLLWASALVLVLAATALLVLSDDAQLLKLGIVAALWAALVGAMVASRLRNRLADREERADELQRIYQLELEREVEARQEFEVEAENEARKKVAEESRNEVEALRAELRTLRESLEHILGGDVLFERVALRAESTRVRSLGDGSGQTRSEPKVIQQQPGRELPAAPPVGATPPEANTELMSRLTNDQARPKQRNGQPRPARPQYVRPTGHAPPATESSRPTRQPAPQQPPAEPAAPHQTGPQPVAAQATPPAHPPQPPAQQQQGVASSGPHQTGRRQAPSTAPNPAQREEPAASSERKPLGEATGRAAGAHAEGTSVNDLLAAYGGGSDSRRHRRRRD